jgi:hypothetical protein
VERIADGLERLCSNARDEILLAAPFIKCLALKRLIGVIRPSVSVQIVTRWLPQDIKAGVTDIEVWDIVKARRQTRLRLRQDLHAKYYRADDRCLVGSANLTLAALGLSAAPNLELLIPAYVDSAGLGGFEDQLLAGAIDVDDDLADLMRSVVSQLPIFDGVNDLEQINLVHSTPLTTWIPTLRQPQDLFVAYVGRLEVLSSVARRCAAADLSMLRVPLGLDEVPFRAAVGVALLGMPVVAAVSRFVAEPRRFGEVRDFLAQLLESPATSSREWQVLLRWMVYFLGDRFEYRRARHSEVIVRRSGSTANT